MPGSRSSVFGEAEDLQAALSADGVAGLLVTGQGQFRARLTQVELDRLRLTAVEEAQPRIAFVTVPSDMVLVSFPIKKRPSPLWGGIEIRTGEMITFGRGQRLHARIHGASYWGSILASDQWLAEYGRALRGALFDIPPATRWRPPHAAARHLLDLHRAAIRMAEARARTLTDIQAAHGLEQQLLQALIECLSEEAEEERAAGRRQRDILARFEDLLQLEPFKGISAIRAALNISDRLLRECCHTQLGIGPTRYLRLRRMQQVYRALREERPGTTSVSELARRHGFRDPGRFATYYRALYGELPSATLRRGSGRVAELPLGRLQ